MSKAVLISIHPEWCEKIISGEKTIEVRKTRPKLEPPFKCYIYCTENGAATHPKRYVWKRRDDGFGYYWNGNVIGEFVCDYVKTFPYVSVPTAGAILNMPEDEETPIETEEMYLITDEELTQTCLSYRELVEYGAHQTLYGWHISDLVFYDQPKELSEFWSADKCPYAGASGCRYPYHCFRAGQQTRCGETVTRAPQSWRYVAELGGGAV